MNTLGKLLFLFILIMGLIILITCCVPIEPVENGEPAEAIYDIRPPGGIKNLPVLAILYPEYESHEYGLVDEDFKRYVLKQVEGTGYIDIRWYHVDKIDMTYIKYAYVYYEKEK